MAWQRVRGHDRWIKTFEHVVQRGRLAHSYLLVGPQGVGKKLFATELGKALLCEGNPAGPANPLAACDHCPSCGMVDAGTHPDLIIAERPEEMNVFPISVMQEVCRNFSLKSARGRGKVAIVDDVDDLHDESANCFLKTLEEPPPHSLFLLIGTSRDQQMPTILSRCQVVRFAALPEEMVTEFLQAQGVTDTALIPRLLRLANGSPGQALALADSELWSFRQEFLDELCRHPFDPIAASKNWMEFVEKAGKEAPLQRRQAENVLRLVMEFIRDALAFQLGNVVPVADPEELQRIKAFAAHRTPDRLLELLDRCLETETQIRRYVQVPLVLEGLVDAFCE